MDNSPYPVDGIDGTSKPQSYPSPASFPFDHGQSGSTLPPPLPSITSRKPMYGSNPPIPHTGTPNMPSNTHNLPPTYAQDTQAGVHDGLYLTAQRTSQSMTPGTANASSHTYPSAPAPTGTRSLPILRPKPPGGLMGQNGSPYSPGSPMHANGVLGEKQQPTHVVGAQGRRGILPSSPGRPAAPAAGTSDAKKIVIPVKDTDDKFPCPHCTNRYLHAKHLKRHLLRHTGERPYKCSLCKDAFSRSDILKHHYQKCYVRRGNPTGASQSYPEAYVQNPPPQTTVGMPEGDMGQMDGRLDDTVGLIHRVNLLSGAA